MQVFTIFNDYINQKGFLNKEALNKGLASLSLIFVCLRASLQPDSETQDKAVT